MGHADYHSVDGGDLFTGRPYGYTEEYQSYEQTGSTTGKTGCGYLWAINIGRPEGSCFNEKGQTVWLAQGVSDCPRGLTNMVGASIPTLSAPCYVMNGSSISCTYSKYSNKTTGAVWWAGSRTITTPTYGYVTRTRLATYDKQSGLFSLGIGVPYAALNGGLYSTRRGTVPAGHAYKN